MSERKSRIGTTTHSFRPTSNLADKLAREHSCSGKPLQRIGLMPVAWCAGDGVIARIIEIYPDGFAARMLATGDEYEFRATDELPETSEGINQLLQSVEVDAEVLIEPAKMVPAPSLSKRAELHARSHPPQPISQLGKLMHQVAASDRISALYCGLCYQILLIVAGQTMDGPPTR